MSAVFRRAEKGAEAIEVSESWSLADQIADVIAWLQHDENAELARGMVLDIGFDCRLGPRIAVQGETIPLEFMQRLCALDITLWLSIYPPDPINYALRSLN